MFHFKIVVLLALGKLAFGGCAGGKPTRVVHSYSAPASLTTIMLNNPSEISQYITVTISAKGQEQINNYHITNKFGICTGVISGSCSSWTIPNGSVLSCNAAFKECSATFSLAATAVKRLGFGSILDAPGPCYYGCPPLRLNSPDAGSSIKISVCDETSQGSGFIQGWTDFFHDVANTDIIVPINGGRPF